MPKVIAKERGFLSASGTPVDAGAVFEQPVGRDGKLITAKWFEPVPDAAEAAKPAEEQPVAKRKYTRRESAEPQS